MIIQKVPVLLEGGGLERRRRDGSPKREFIPRRGLYIIVGITILLLIYWHLSSENSIRRKLTSPSISARSHEKLLQQLDPKTIGRTN